MIIIKLFFLYTQTTHTINILYYRLMNLKLMNLLSTVVEVTIKNLHIVCKKYMYVVNDKKRKSINLCCFINIDD
jgi:hypothetical protein